MCGPPCCSASAEAWHSTSRALRCTQKARRSVSASSLYCALSSRVCSVSSVAAATAAALPAWLWMCVSASLGHASSGGVLSPRDGLCMSCTNRFRRVPTSDCSDACSKDVVKKHVDDGPGSTPGQIIEGQHEITPIDASQEGTLRDSAIAPAGFAGGMWLCRRFAALGCAAGWRCC